MASEYIEKEIKKLLDAGSDEQARAYEMKTKIHVIRITTQESAAAFVNGTDKAIDKIFGTEPSIYKTIAKGLNTKSIWQNILRQVFRNLRNQNASITGTKIQNYSKINKLGDLSLAKRSIWIMPSSTEDDFKIQVNETALKYNLSKIAAALRAQAWDDWIDLVEEQGLTDGVAKQLKREKSRGRKSLGNTTHFSHDEQFTVGLARAEEFMESLAGAQIEIKFSYQDTSMNFVDFLRNSLKIKYEELPDMDADGVIKGLRRAVYGTIEQQGAKLDTDWTSTLGKGVYNDIINSARTYLSKNRPVGMSEQDALDSSGSSTFREDYTKGKTYESAKVLSKSLKNVKKAVLKKPKKRKDKKINIKPKKLNISKTTGGIRLTPVIKNRKASGKKMEEISPAKLRGLINRRLPAEVRRNMGRPALINRTGRFSNSVKLQNLRMGRTNLIGEYTYQLSPYETFENTGERQWPTGYNPKPLISKSIRNLAAEYVQEKFTLRRI